MQSVNFGLCVCFVQTNDAILHFIVHLLYSPLPKESPYACKQSGRGGRGNADTVQTRMTYEVPYCTCGAPRQFECQLMPNLLGVLDVDKHARSNNKKSTSHLSIDELMSREHGGMNWGALAIYTCKQNCDDSREDYVIVQDSVDGNPEKIAGITEDSMVVDVDKCEEKYEDNEDDFDDVNADCSKDV